MKRPDAESGRDRPRRLIDPTRSRGRDEGISTITAAVSIVVLLGFAALAIDGSNLYRERGDAQNAADLAAYAAANEACTGGSRPVEKGRAQAAANGFDDSDPDIAVGITKEPAGWRAEITANADRYFSRILEANSLKVNAVAVVRCVKGDTSGGYAIFAGGDCNGKKALNWSGNGNYVDGNVHSNDDFKMAGHNTITGKVSYVTSSYASGPQIDFQGGRPLQESWADWPVKYRTEDFLPGGRVDQEVAAEHVHRGAKFDLNEANLQQGGVYIATEEIKISGREYSANVTLVTLPTEEGKGLVRISGNLMRLEPFWKDVVVFSDYYEGGSDYPYAPGPYSSKPDCAGEGIIFDGGLNRWNGLLVAPRSTINIHMHNNTQLAGGTIGWAVKLGGSELMLSGKAGGGHGENQLELVR